jgi:hypothetical protein
LGDSCQQEDEEDYEEEFSNNSDDDYDDDEKVQVIDGQKLNEQTGLGLLNFAHNSTSVQHKTRLLQSSFNDCPRWLVR